MASEDEIAGVYEDYLEKESDGSLLATLGIALNKERGNSYAKIFEDYERTQLISMIQNIDWTGKLDTGFEDLRKNISTNDSCG